MMETVDLSPKESADQLQGLYEGLVDVVAATLKNGDNPGVRVRPYAHGVSGRTHWTIGIDGLLTGPNMDFVTALNALHKDAFFRDEKGPNGQSLGFKVHLPIPKTRQVPIARGGGGGGGKRFAKRRYDSRFHPHPTPPPPTIEWVGLLWCITSAVGGLLYYRVQAGLY